jgi:hypothetical protein
MNVALVSNEKWKGEVRMIIDLSPSKAFYGKMEMFVNAVMA